MTRACEPWKLDPRFWYVCFDHWDNSFGNNASGPCLAVVDDFGDLVPSTGPQD